ncbi:MarR family winged helix-turn-helix transcriptional regulator [Clostridium boliviensis]|uniref:MarR family winged helix-turn-helix transcriptional regulator n=1 Tax=Clostridium boliviensis TaxID=318465 RepID=A0ABU4GHM2_9CLOT|nr:MarR family winged helix-turn-helix transcriptional regulator [Clostridium boliviensis]MDW2797120.1 MarR family winged helix-turn-helix transcriptional regulator [Clostridium boliviensis]
MRKNDTPEEQTCSLNSCLFFTTVKLSRVFGKVAENAFSKTGLSPSHSLLLSLVNQKEEILQKELGETLFLTPSTITRLIEKLERKKLVSKRCEGKSVILSTTPEGLALQTTIMESWESLHREYQGILTQEETVLFLNLSKKLLGKLENN